MLNNLLIDPNSTHSWLYPICWLFGHGKTWNHPGLKTIPPGQDRSHAIALETCYRCGRTKYVDEDW